MRMTDHNCLWADKKPCTVCGYHPLYPDFDKAVHYERQKQREILDAEDAEYAERVAAETEARAELHRRRNSRRQQPDTDTDISPWRNRGGWGERYDDGPRQINLLTGEIRYDPTDEQWDLAEEAELEEYKRKRKIDPHYLDLEDFEDSIDAYVEAADDEGEEDEPDPNDFKSFFDFWGAAQRNKKPTQAQEAKLRDFIEKYGGAKEAPKATPPRRAKKASVASDVVEVDGELVPPNGLVKWSPQPRGREEEKSSSSIEAAALAQLDKATDKVLKKLVNMPNLSAHAQVALFEKLVSRATGPSGSTYMNMLADLSRNPCLTEELQIKFVQKKDWDRSSYWRDDESHNRTITAINMDICKNPNLTEKAQLLTVSAENNVYYYYRLRSLAERDRLTEKVQLAILAKIECSGFDRSSGGLVQAFESNQSLTPTVRKKFERLMDSYEEPRDELLTWATEKDG